VKVVFLAPAYPPEMQQYTRGLAEVGASVYGVGDAPAATLPRSLKQHLTDYLQVPRLLDEADVTERVYQWVRGRGVDRVLANWEVMVLTAARLRERLGVPGMSYDTVLGFRDKQLMKERVAAAGLRVPRATRVKTAAEARAAAARFGYPLVWKPIAGAGSADTYQLDGDADLERALAATQHVDECSLEEFIDGDEFTFDTVSHRRPPGVHERRAVPAQAADRPHQRVDQPGDRHRPPPRAAGLGRRRRARQAGARRSAWATASPTWSGSQAVGRGGVRRDRLPPGRRAPRRSDELHLRHRPVPRVGAGGVLGSRSRRRPPASTTSRSSSSAPSARAGSPAITGLREFLRARASTSSSRKLLPVGAQRRNWKHTLVSDGYILLRHPDWRTAVELANMVATDVTMYAE
jgi:hypothetical protein